MIGVIVVGGFTYSEIGRRAPLLRAVGGSSLVTIFLPSLLFFETMNGSFGVP